MEVQLKYFHIILRIRGVFLSDFSTKAKFVCHRELSLYFTVNLWQRFASVMIRCVLCLSKHSRLKTHCSLLIGIGMLKLSGPSAFIKERMGY